MNNYGAPIRVIDKRYPRTGYTLTNNAGVHYAIKWNGGDIEAFPPGEHITTKPERKYGRPAKSRAASAPFRPCPRAKGIKYGVKVRGSGYSAVQIFEPKCIERYVSRIYFSRAEAARAATRFSEGATEQPITEWHPI